MENTVGISKMEIYNLNMNMNITLAKNMGIILFIDRIEHYRKKVCFKMDKK